jgi:hypothetical protein
MHTLRSLVDIKESPLRPHGSILIRRNAQNNYYNTTFSLRRGAPYLIFEVFSLLSSIPKKSMVISSCARDILRNQITKPLEKTTDPQPALLDLYYIHRTMGESRVNDVS